MTRKNPLIELLEEITWNMSPERQDAITLIITHRGARGDIKAIQMPDIARFDKGYLYVRKQEGEKGMDYDEQVPIPLHRVIRVVDIDGRPLYEKRNVEKEDV